MNIKNKNSNQSSFYGLTDEEVTKKRCEFGENSFSPVKRESLWKTFFGKFKDPIIIILLVAMLLSFIVSCYNFSEGESSVVFFEPLGVLLAITLATCIAFYFELKSEKEFDILNQVNDDIYYKVYRNGQITQVLKKDIVVGDVVVLETGEQIPADGKLLKAVSLIVDESILTGEPSVEKTTNPDAFEPQATYPSNIINRDTIILDGHCLYQVTKVGDQTEAGKIFKGVQIDNNKKTPLNKQLHGLANLITKVSYGIATLVIIGSVVIYAMKGNFSDFQWNEALSFFLNKIMIAVTIIVVAVPEGLPMSISLSLAYSMRSMMKTNNLVRRMHACETMGAATVICTDKTGTLTENRMTLTDTYFDENINKKNEIISLSMAVNSTAFLDCSNEKKIEPLGNPTEGALLIWLKNNGIDYLKLREDNPIVNQLTFSTERKYMATVIRTAENKILLLVKGAPEIVQKFCSISQQDNTRYQKKLFEYQNKAKRTIGFAYKELQNENEVVFQNGKLITKGLLYIGIVAIEDPIRKEVPEAIANCRQAGVKVKIITGDTAETAKEIGRQIGLWDNSCTDANIIQGTEFEALTDEELLKRVQNIHIMCRARPTDKERFIRLLQEQGEVVAVTGDGTNDAPALNRADVGLSMGDGTAVAKEASDITILDNSFKSITQALLWGRSLYRNIQRFILFQMTINVVACLIVLIGAFLGTESPLTVTQMLWVNLIMDTFAALALASLPPNKKVLEEMPRSKNENIISTEMKQIILITGGLFVFFLFGFIQYFKLFEITNFSDFKIDDFFNAFFHLSDTNGELSVKELSIFFSIFVFLQFWNIFNAKAFMTERSAFANLKNCKEFFYILIVILVGQIMITNFGGEMFRVVPLSLIEWFLIMVYTSVVLWIGEIWRVFTTKKR